MSTSELSPSPAIPLKERLPDFAAFLMRSNLRYAQQREARREKDISKSLKRELGKIGTISLNVSERLETECDIVALDPYGRRNTPVRTEHLAWDLGAEDTSNTDVYAPHIYLAHSNLRFYLGDRGLALPHTPEPSPALLTSVMNLHEQLEEKAQ